MSGQLQHQKRRESNCNTARQAKEEQITILVKCERKGIEGPTTTPEDGQKKGKPQHHKTGQRGAN